mgnify:CR=1 FL=1|tara:strand:- start:210 stop:743 length:534 start_codon:yes stop_codon:yes gene_type:complete
MPLEYDPMSSKILYQGKKVGEYRVEDGVAKVSLEITYECSTAEWIVPLSWFDYGLNQLQQYRDNQRPVSLEVGTDEDDIGERYTSLRLLTEKTIKRKGYVWRFHKNDDDTWPSVLHGHEYDKNLKLDAVTGEIYDAGTRERCMRLNRKTLKFIQSELRESPDFSDLVLKCIGGDEET